MNVTVPSKKDHGVARAAAVTFVGDGTAAIIKLGFNPLCLDMINTTDVVSYKKLSVMNATDCFKSVAVGTNTVDTTSQILFNGDGTVTIAAATNIAGKVFSLFVH